MKKIITKKELFLWGVFLSQFSFVSAKNTENVDTVQQEESFIVEKKKRKRGGPSRNTLKENYATQTGELIKKAPKVQRHLAQLQEVLIDDVYALLENDKNGRLEVMDKKDIEMRINQIDNLMNQLQDFDKEVAEILVALK